MRGEERDGPRDIGDIIDIEIVVVGKKKEVEKSREMSFRFCWEEERGRGEVCRRSIPASPEIQRVLLLLIWRRGDKKSSEEKGEVKVVIQPPRKISRKEGSLPRSRRGRLFARPLTTIFSHPLSAFSSLLLPSCRRCSPLSS